MNLEAQAISTVNKLLANRNYHDGEKILQEVVQNWARRYSIGKYPNNTHFEFRSIQLQYPDLEKPPVQDICEFVIFDYESRFENILRGLSREWIFRSIRYDALRHERQENSAQKRGLKTGLKIWEIHDSVWPGRAILKILSKLSLNDGLDFMAVVLVQWSRRFDAAGFIDWVRSLGWPILDDMPGDDYISQCAILFSAMAFQMEDIVPIYWELIHERERRIEV